MALDAAAVLELSCPLLLLFAAGSSSSTQSFGSISSGRNSSTTGLLMLCSSYMVMPVACVATVLKNVGFLAASASRAALHQALCRGGGGWTDALSSRRKVGETKTTRKDPTPLWRVNEEVSILEQGQYGQTRMLRSHCRGIDRITHSITPWHGCARFITNSF
jgi:hypothetical protein